jgi:hypothetical protein
MHASIRHEGDTIAVTWATRILDPGITPPEGDTILDLVRTTEMVWGRALKIRVTMTVTIEGEFRIISAFRFLDPLQADVVSISQVSAQTQGLLPKATIGPACVCATAPGVSVQEAALLLIQACDM